MKLFTYLPNVFPFAVKKKKAHATEVKIFLGNNNDVLLLVRKKRRQNTLIETRLVTPGFLLCHGWLPKRIRYIEK